ncbi:pseudouridine synthase [Spiractinospora alimapuensis]|uniref:pseudouridine synthase n=1 Tax=Spiractinospora alimapuensis TaxID=2820884 RepID=UPI001F1D3AF8|nr:pseudouridine synthase [Spiractinospora alimapuensis]
MNTPPRKRDTPGGDAPRGRRDGAHAQRSGRGSTSGTGGKPARDSRTDSAQRRDGARSGPRDGSNQGRRDSRDDRDGRDGRDGRQRRDNKEGQRRDGRDGRDAQRRDGGAGRGARPNTRSGARQGGGQRASNAERNLSREAQARLRRLRDEYTPRDDDRPAGERDSYVDVPGGIRLQKALAQAGVASRRASEEMIAQGRVSVDGHVVRRFGARVDVTASEIRVDGMTVVTEPGRHYYALNKPRGVVSTMSDPEGRPTLADYTSQTTGRLFHVGRLDTETEGLILLTDDGELANRLTHPRYRILKTYIATVPGPVPRHLVTEVSKGVELDDGPVQVDSFRVVDNAEPRALVEVVLHEGRKHIVRRLLESVGLPVQDLARTQVGPIGLHTLKTGTVRALTSREVSELYTAAGM